MDKILKYFTPLVSTEAEKKMSDEYYELANHIFNTLPPSAESTVALRKLLESMDAALRAVRDL